MGDSVYDPNYNESVSTGASRYFNTALLNAIPTLDYDQTQDLICAAQEHLQKLETREIARRRDEIMVLIEDFHKDFPGVSLEY